MTPPAGLQVPRPSDALWRPCQLPAQKRVVLRSPQWSEPVRRAGGVGSTPCMCPHPQGSLRPPQAKAAIPPVLHHLRRPGRPGQGPTWFASLGSQCTAASRLTTHSAGSRRACPPAAALPQDPGPCQLGPCFTPPQVRQVRPCRSPAAAPSRNLRGALGCRPSARLRERTDTRKGTDAVSK